MMTRRVMVAAAAVDGALLLLLLWFGSPFLAWLNVLGIALFGCAYWMLVRRLNGPALLLIWTQVLGHAAIGTLLVGWDSGFHYYLLLFIPAIIVSGGRWLSWLLLCLLLVFYLGLNAVAQLAGAATPLEPTGLWVVQAFNVAIVFAMASYTARFYYVTVRSAEKRLVEMATTDPLTGLLNRRHLLALAEPMMAQARRLSTPCALAIADIDHFKQINDRYGHEAGDHVIARVGKLLSGLTRGQDIVARWGGEEFLFLLPTTDRAAALAMAERVCNAAAATVVEHGGLTIPFTVSIGVAELLPGEALGDAIARADLAMYQSKELGRNRVTAAG